MNPIPKNTVVIGGSSGLGKVVAHAYAKDGFHVSVVSRNRPAFIDETSNFSHFSADLSGLDFHKAHELASLIVGNSGRPSYIIFCQRYRGGERSFANELFISISATELLIEAFVPHFAADGDRAIVAVSSVYADYVGSSQPLSYHVVKSGLNALIRYYAVDLGKKGIRSNAIAPLTYLKDESKHIYLENSTTMEKYKKLVPLKRMPTAQECADAMKYLGSEKASFINGQIIYVDGGVSAVWPEELV